MIALVTGANRGIGLEVCRQLADAGHEVVLTSRDAEKGRTALEKIRKKEMKLHFHQLDVTDEESAGQAFQFLKKTFGKLDILINNAGINYDTWHNALNADLKESHQTLEVNLFGAWRVAQALIPLMIGQCSGPTCSSPSRT